MPRPVTLQFSQWDELHQIQRGMLRELAEAMRGIDTALSADLFLAIKALDKRGWQEWRVRAVIEKVLAKHRKRIEKTHKTLVRQASRHADIYMERLERFAVLDRNWYPIPPSEVAAWSEPGRMAGATSAVLAYARGASTAGRMTSALSPTLHLLDPSSATEVTGRVLRAMREAQSLDFASRELVSNWPRFKSPISGGQGPIGYQAQFPKILETIKTHVRELGDLTGDQLKPELDKINAYMQRLKQGGRVRNAYAELCKDLADGKAGEAAIEKWAHQKQRYVAERILETEQQAAFRARQVEQGQGKPWIIGYRWHMNSGRHRRWLFTRPGVHRNSQASKRIPGLKGHHCICEVLNGTIIPVDEYKERWIAGGHPHCCCYFEEVVDQEKLFKSGETEEETAWLNAARF